MNNELKQFDIGIIGAGPAGYSAAVYAARAGFTVALWLGPEPGGQLTTTNDVENFIGFPDGIQGPELMERSKKQAARFGTQLLEGKITKIEQNDQGFLLHGEKTSAQVKTVIIATGAVAKWLGTESEEKFKGRGVSGCATCDAFFFRDKNVAVVGAGDVAMEDAQTLAKVAASVTVFVRKGEDQVRASRIMFERAKENPKIKFMFNTEIDEFMGEMKLDKIHIKNNKSGETSEMPIDGVFIAIGHRPNTDFCQDIIDTDAEGYITTNGVKTNIPGIYAAGDVMDRVYRQAITSAGTGCMAALEAKKYLEEN
ncbi:thioredoxin-disulfide reductase [Candidatus Uhrbacteria bacterium]|nr:thioredoxin-disulfide reductase [Candidatus Uhrbacteria bacterium]